MNSNWKKAFERLQKARAGYEKANVEAWDAAGGKAERQSGDRSLDWYLAERVRLPAEMVRRRTDAEEFRYDPLWLDDLYLRKPIPQWLRSYPTQQEETD